MKVCALLIGINNSMLLVNVVNSPSVSRSLAIEAALAQFLHSVNCSAQMWQFFPIAKERSVLLPVQVARAVNLLFVAFANKHAKSTPQVENLFPFNGALATPKSRLTKKLII